MRVYIAGPVTGRDPKECHAAFEAAKERLKQQGFEAVNPLESQPIGVVWEIALAGDIPLLLSCHAIVLMPGWEKSKGARLEVLVARLLGRDVIGLDGHPVPALDLREALHSLVEEHFVSGDSILTEAQRLVWGHRQADYDHPLPNFERIAAGWNVILEHSLVAPITAEQVGLMNIWQKIARHVHKPKRDNLVDMAGYAATVQRVVDRRAGRE